MATISNVSQFSPTQVSGCSLWLDAADPFNNGTTPTSGTVISTWSDKSGNGYNATVASGRVGGTFNTAFNCVYFQTSNVGYATSHPANPTVETMFIVANIDSPANINNNTIIGGQTGARSFGFGYAGSGGSGRSSYLNNAVAWQNNSIVGPATQTTALITGTVSNTTNVTVSLNGATSGASYTSGTITAWTAGTTTYLGVDTGNLQYYYKGFVMEILFYNSILPAPQRQQVEGYLAWKWNLQASLPTTHPFYTNPFVRSVPITPIVLPFAERTNYSLVPTQISGCALWLDAADANSVVTTGSNVTQWNDKSGNTRHMSNATLASTPTYNRIGFNNLPTISFSPSIFNFLQNTSFNFNSLPSITLFIIVQRISNTITFQRFFSAATTIGGADQSSTTAFNLNTSSANDGVLYERNNVYSTKATLNTLNPCMIELIINGSSTNIDSFVANTNYIYTNGSFGTSSTGSANGNNFNLVHVRLGNAAGNNSLNAFEQLQGNISEIVMFNKALNLNEFRQVEGYLAWKWNLQASLPSTHPFFRNPFIANLSITTPIANVYRITNRGFNPPTLPGMALWLDAADPFNNGTQPSSGTTISTWNDKSGSGNNATPHATSPRYIQNIQNSLPGLYFAGSNTLKCGVFLTATSFSCFLVTNKNANVGLGVWKKQFGSYFIMENVIKVGVNNFTGYIENALITVPNFTNTNIYALTLSSSSSVGSAFTFNGSFNGSNTTISGTSTYGNATTCDQQVSVGGLMETGSPISQMTGYINEVIIYNTALTTTQRQQVEGYLAWKWGLQKSLPTNHPFYLFPPG